LNRFREGPIYAETVLQHENLHLAAQKIVDDEAKQLGLDPWDHWTDTMHKLYDDMTPKQRSYMEQTYGKVTPRSIAAEFVRALGETSLTGRTSESFRFWDQ